VLLLARKELLEHLLSLRFAVCASMLGGLVLVSGFVMYGDYRVRMENHAVLEARAVPRPGEEGVLAVVAPRPLSILARGLDEVLDRGYTITAFLGIEPHERQTPAISLFALMAAPDLLYVVKALLSLVALLLAYDSISGERERGTLRLMLSFPLSRGQVVAGKMLGGLLAVTVPFLLAVLVSLTAIRAGGRVAFGSQELVRLVLMLLAAVLYASLFFALGVLVSALCRSSPQALVILLFAWALLVFAVPNLGQLVAAELQPLPSAETQEALRMQTFARNRFIAIQSRGEDPAGSFRAFNQEYDRRVEEYRARLEALVQTGRRWCRLSPAASLTYVFTDLAGTGIGDLRRLNAQLMQYKSAHLPELIVSLHGGEAAPPRFTYQPEGQSGAWRRVRLDLLLLAGTALVLSLAAVSAALRTDPR
jgi:hypothetical protein